MHTDISLYVQIGRGVIQVVTWAAKKLSHNRSLSAAELDLLDEQIYEYLADGKCASPQGLWNAVYVGAIVADIPFSVAFPPELSGWVKFVWWLKNMRYELRHRWRKQFQLIPQDAVTKRMRKLWREGRLQRVGGDKEYYRLANR